MGTSAATAIGITGSPSPPPNYRGEEPCSIQVFLSARVRSPCATSRVVLEPGAVIGREATIGDGTTIAAGAVIGFRSALGRDCYVGAGATIIHAIVGNGVIFHPGARIGQDGFGFAMGAMGT